MNLEVREEPITALADYAQVSGAFLVSRVLELTVRGGGIPGFVLAERAVDVPWPKDYDAIPQNGPAHWAHRFDVSSWALFAARADGRRIGGAVVTSDTPALLWDIRVSPEARGRGVGSALFRHAKSWAAARGCRQLAIETQNINVPACRFYERQGCELGAVHRFAYPELPREVQLIWYADLSSDAS